MRSAIFAILALFAAAVNAHFQLQFPAPRGPFDEDNEPTFCDGYTDGPASNRTQFPLSGGFFTLDSEHPQWTAGVLVSTAENVTSFQNFSQVNGFFQVQGEGDFCIPLDFSKSNITGLHSGQNVTIQIVFSGGDGNLYQCADLTLADSVNLSSVECKNATSSSNPGTGSGNSGNSTGSGGSGSGNNTSSAVIVKQAERVAGLSTVAALIGLLLL